MSVSIEVKSYNYDELVNGIMGLCKTDNKELVEKILLAGGDHIGDRYLILNNEYWEEFDSYYNVSSVLDEVFDVEDVFGNCFCTFHDKYDEKGAVPSVSKEEIKQACGLD